MVKTKSLAIILNHNLPEYTDRLFLSLNDPGNEEYDLLVLDNGSKPSLISIYTSIRFERNLYWGGALNEAFRMVLNNDNYDSLLFLNNDIEVNGKIFITALRNELFLGDFAIVTPCIAGEPSPYKHMQNWGSKTPRCVKWIDNQAPLIHRKLIERVKKFDDSLFCGWGQELICYDVCMDNGWKIGVCDHITLLHHAKQTVRQKRLFTENSQQNTPVKESEFEGKAWGALTDYFSKHPIRNGNFDELRAYADDYFYKLF
jgi:GT2 family glycosyltransferase